MAEVIHTLKRGAEILNDALLNKGTAFAQEERDHLGLNGLLPPFISTVEQQIARTLRQLNQKKTPLEKYECLIQLLNRNEILFYQLVCRYPVEMLPLIYTPTVGDAALEYSRIYIPQRGLYLSYLMKDRVHEAFSNYHIDEVDVVVVTDGERILGLGDLGVGGMAIPIGKTSLYTVLAGIHPSHILPIILDVGTNNQELLKDDLYLGWRHPRMEGAEYDAFIEQFVLALKKKYPKVLLQWEDFGRGNARRLLDRYREKILSFNDDIQGTAAVVLGGLFAAHRAANRQLKNERVAILGGGSAGTGIADIIVDAMVAEGLSLEEARKRIYIIDIEGLVHFGTKQIFEPQKPYIHSQESLKGWKIHTSHITLLDVLLNAKPSILIGVSAQAGAFTREIVEQMQKNSPKPIIFPLSNPTTKAECTPDDVIRWTKGEAIVATGSPFPPVIYQGKTFRVSQCNNVYIFPGMGLGALASHAKKITDGMFVAAAKALADHAPILKDPTAPLFPKIEDVRMVSQAIALAVAQKAYEDGVAPLAQNLKEAISSRVWEPRYPTYR